MTCEALVRNGGFISPREQGLLDNAGVAIAGTGGDGGQLALTLARMGLRRFALADPEVFEAQNLNRQAGCRSSTLGQNKASVIGALISDINPEAEVRVFSEGVTPANIDLFLDGATILAPSTDASDSRRLGGRQKRQPSSTRPAGPRLPGQPSARQVSREG